MVLSNFFGPVLFAKGIGARRRRQFAGCFSALLLAACGSGGAPIETAPAGPSLGGVVADEPRAAYVGRDILAAGGSAADAAAAMYFTMSVTLPSRASLGGGGVCLVFDPKSREAQALEFLARAPTRLSPGADRPSAIPGAVRGFYSLHARYGRLRWSQVMVPAENLARFGAPVSRAFAEDIRQVSAAVMAQPAARRALSTDDGRGIVGEGDRLAQNDLASVLARIRVDGPGDFYGGITARKLIEGARAAGGPIEANDLEGYQPVWNPALEIKTDGRTAYFPPPPPMGGAVAAEMWAMLVAHDRFENADPGERAHLLAETAARAAVERARWQPLVGTAGFDAKSIISRTHTEALMDDYRPDAHTPASTFPGAARPTPENPAAASFIAVDVTGLAVACAVTANNLFGTGRIAEGTGIVLASAPGPGGRGATALGPMIVGDGKQFIFAASASGGQVAPTAMVATAARTLLDDAPLAEAVAAARVHGGVAPDMTFVEQSADPEIVAGLGARGHKVALTPAIGHVAAASCPMGSPDDPGSCAFVSDPRGAGLAVRAE